MISTAPERAPDVHHVIAQHYGVSLGFVQEVADRALGIGSSKSLPEFNTRQFKRVPANWFERLVESTWLFVGITTVIAFSIFELLGSSTGLSRALPIQIRTGLAILAVIVIFTQAYAAFYHGRARTGALTSVLFGLFALPFLTTSFFPLRFRWEGIIPAISLIVPHLFIAVPAGMAGAYQRMRLSEQFDRTLDRQALLEKLFQLRQRYRSAKESAADYSSNAWWQGRETPMTKLIGIAFSVSAVWAVIGTLIFKFADPTGSMFMGAQGVREPGAAQIAALLATSVIAFSIQLGLAFYAGTIKRAGIVMTIFFVVGVGMSWAPISTPAIRHIQTQPGNLAFAAMLSIVVAVVGGLGAQAEQRKAWTRRITAGDPDALLGELVALECRLRPQSKAVCVLVVDAFRSSLMKAEADPFEAEWTFREYQSWIAHHCSQHLGEVHATAGDGAVIGFPTARNAYAAAMQMQESIHEFNARRSLLQHAFRLRIGLHSGAIADSLDKVQYTEVIDIAAHVEKAAPVGGIALSEPVRAELGLYHLTAQPELVDGYRIYTSAGAKFEI